jgi:hypothetical protein
MPVDLYDTATAQRTSASGAGMDQAADDRVAEEFRREYLDAQQVRAAQQPAIRKKPELEENKILKGPKLGGSRSARAAMHAALQKGSTDGSKK